MILPSTRGPLHLATAEHVNVNVVNALRTVLSVVDDHAIALVEALLCGNVASNAHEVAEESVVL